MEIEKIKFEKVVSDNEKMSKKNEPWRILEFLCTTEDQFPKKIVFKILSSNGGKQKLIDFIYNLPINEDIHVRFDLVSNEFNGRWYTEASVWDVFRAVASSSDQNNTTAPKREESSSNQTKQMPLPSLNIEKQAQNTDNESQDLPF